MIVTFFMSCREEAREHGDDEASEQTNPRTSLEEEYLETEKKVGIQSSSFGLVLRFK